jgi:ABC-type molybdate transport system permease subunit
MGSDDDARSLGEFGQCWFSVAASGQTQAATTFIHDAIEERELAGAYGMYVLLAIMGVALPRILEWANRQQRPQARKAHEHSRRAPFERWQRRSR